MKNTLEKLVAEALREAGVEAPEFVVEHPSDLKMGDYSTNAVIKYGHKEEVLKYLEGNKPEEIERVELAGPGFLNFYLSKEFFKKSIGEIIEKGESFGRGDHAKGLKVMIEHTQPNPFKEFHIGHLMNNAIGEALSRIIKANGAEVQTATYHGDKGLHVAKAVWALLKDLNLGLGAYAVGHKAYEEDENAKKEILEINKKIYDGSDIRINEVFELGRKQSLDYFESIYEKLNSSFDHHFLESESGEIGKKIVEENVGRIFDESEGATIYRGEKAGLHTRVFLNSEKLPTYEAKEVGLAHIKKEKFPFDMSITVTASEQDAFFKVVESAIGEVFPELKGKLKHLSHGMLRLPTGKMSSRTGDVITAESLIEEVKKSIEEKGNTASDDIAVGAIKYMILRQGIGNDIIFDFEKSVSTEGDSGVYLQYAYARTNSLLAKSENDWDATAPREEMHEIEKLLYRFPEIVERAGKEFAPNLITTYLTELASSFNNFYAHEQVIGDSPESAYRLAVAKAFNTVMKNGLDILGMPSPERV